MKRRREENSFVGGGRKEKEGKMKKHRGSSHERLIIYTVEITRAVRRHNLENYASSKSLRDLTTTKSVHGAALIHRPRGTWPRPLLLRRGRVGSRLAERAGEKLLFNTTEFTVTHPGYQTVSRLIMNFIQYASLLVSTTTFICLILFEINDR